MLKRQGKRHVLRPDDVPALRGCASIATAPAGEPVTISGRVVRITLLPGIEPAEARIVLRVTDGSAEAALTFTRADAPRLSTGSHVVADGMFGSFDQPRAFDPLLLTIVDR